ncbi:hypothetical protein EIP91_009359 [Steccherinum ochraceum]|uniref:Uncharacterized protein n=1 Tax=Steccherinum ochraceum TaxID=92696 RepID=A0A4R0RTN3_9APHY|nr:hypothetical protein EIP91_009359 [Steccherinum ochraceum]
MAVGLYLVSTLNVFQPTSFLDQDRAKKTQERVGFVANRLGHGMVVVGGKRSRGSKKPNTPPLTAYILSTGFDTTPSSILEILWFRCRRDG